MQTHTIPTIPTMTCRCPLRSTDSAGKGLAPHKALVPNASLHFGDPSQALSEAWLLRAPQQPDAGSGAPPPADVRCVSIHNRTHKKANYLASPAEYFTPSLESVEIILLRLPQPHPADACNKTSPEDFLRACARRSRLGLLRCAGLGP